MFIKYAKIFALLLALLMLTACAGPANEVPPTPTPALVTVESCTSEVPEETSAPWLDYPINSMELAEETVRAELEKMQELGLLSDKLYVVDRAPDFADFFYEEPFLQPGESPVYAIRWYCNSGYGNNWEGDMRYSVAVQLDANTGKLVLVNIEAAADENAEVKYEVPATMYNPYTGEEEVIGENWLYHENFSDLFDEKLSLNQFAELLCEYYECDSWALGGGGALDMEIPLRDITNGTSGNYHVALSFEDEGASLMKYVSVQEFPGRVAIMFGNSYPKG